MEKAFVGSKKVLELTEQARQESRRLANAMSIDVRHALISVSSMPWDAQKSLLSLMPEIRLTDANGVASVDGDTLLRFAWQAFLAEVVEAQHKCVSDNGDEATHVGKVAEAIDKCNPSSRPAWVKDLEEYANKLSDGSCEAHLHVASNTGDVPPPHVIEEFKREIAKCIKEGKTSLATIFAEATSTN